MSELINNSCLMSLNELLDIYQHVSEHFEPNMFDHFEENWKMWRRTM